MPNWCDNILTLRHSDKSKVAALAAELSSEGNGQMFNHLRPNPTGEWQYDWSIDNWGTKWDADIIDWELREEESEIWVSFNSAWSPPTRLYDYLVEQGWFVDAIYYEPGMGYGGIYNSDNGGDDYYEFDFTSREEIEKLPGDLIEFGDLLNKFDEYEIERIEEEWDGVERTEWYPMQTKPVRDGYYELQVKGYEDRVFEQLAKFTNGEWDWWNTESLIGWRGLAEDPNEAKVD